MKKYFLLSLVLVVAFASEAQLDKSDITAFETLFSVDNEIPSPGCALGIFKNGELVYSNGFGFANLEYEIPNTDRSVFRIASTSKQFTAACIIRLVEQGKLKLDQTLQSLFPEFPDYVKDITVKHLLNHTSGIRDYLQLAYLKGYGDEDYYADEDVMKWLINQTSLNFSPGEEFTYSNSGYWLLGQIVNRVSEMNMADFAQQELFEPLGMTDTHFHNDYTQIVKNRASGYIPSRTGGFEISMTTLDMIGDGGIFTSIRDIKKWDDAFYYSKVLSNEFWEMMTDQGVLNDGEVIDYASGLFIEEYNGLKTISHGGAFVGFRAELLRFPEEKVTIAIFANRGDFSPSRKAYEVADLLLKDQFIVEENVIEEPALDIIDAAPSEVYELDQIEGDYEIQPGLIVEITVENDSLSVFQTWNGSKYKIVNMEGNTYQIPGETGISFSFLELEDDKTQVLSVLQGGGTSEARRKEKVDLSSVKLSDYEGEFHSAELDVTYVLTIVDEVLTLQIESSEGMDCTLTAIDQFSLNLGIVLFERSGDDISGFILDSGRVQKLWFKKEY